VEGGAEVRVVGKAGIVGRLHEAGDEALAQILVGSLAGVDAEHRRVTAERLREALRTSEHLGRVVGQSLDVLGLPTVGERVIQHRVVESPLMMRGGEGQEPRLAARELEDRRSRHRASLAHLRGLDAERLFGSA
jgi:hypothetical protein